MLCVRNRLKNFSDFVSYLENSMFWQCLNALRIVKISFNKTNWMNIQLYKLKTYHFCVKIEVYNFKNPSPKGINIP